MGDIRLHNATLVGKPLETGNIRIIDADIEDLLEFGLLDSPTIPSSGLLRILEAIFGQLGLTWEGDPQFWDPMDRNLGGGIFIANVWEEVV